MVNKKTVDVRLTRLIKYWDDVLADAGITGDLPLEETTPKEVMAKFGLSSSQAKAWLEKEPNFSSDVSYHEPHNRRKVNRTIFQDAINLQQSFATD